MSSPRSHAPLAALFGPLLLLLGTGCPQGDVGAPCNHGTVTPPPTKLVSFPALTCNELLCVYGDETLPPDGDCSTNAECNQGAGGSIFECNIPEGATSGSCQLQLSHVLDRSMCSKRCNNDQDCADNAVDDEETSCQGVEDGDDLKFKCVVIQDLGEFCCEKICVCEDDLNLATVSDLESQCGPNGEFKSNVCDDEEEL